MKTYTVHCDHKGRTMSQTGTIEELTDYYSYTLECGNSWNNKINRKPKTIASLITNLNKAVAETQGGYERDYYYI